jgi:ABC-2 type transport system ATP-binding protein
MIALDDGGGDLLALPNRGDDAVATFSGVCKRFDDTTALADVSFTLPRGSVVGLIGRNGAGKSTAIRCLLGIESPSSGQVRVFGEDPLRPSLASRQRLGVMLDDGVPFLGATPDQLMDFAAPLYPRWDNRIEADLRARFRIDGRQKLAKMSLGQRRAVALTLALCPRPDLLVLDEPAANLDPVLRREFLAEVLQLVAEPGRTVVFSSHNLTDVERIADRVIILHEGRVLLDRATDELRESVRQLRLIFPSEAPPTAPVPGILAKSRLGRELLITLDGFDEAALPALQRATGAHVDVSPVSLEDLFIRLTVGPQ